MPLLFLKTAGEIRRQSSGLCVSGERQDGK